MPGDVESPGTGVEPTMAFKLNKAETSRLAEYVQNLRDAESALEDDKAALEEAVNDLIDAFNEKLNAYNAILEEARGFAEDIGQERRGEYDDKSERWQDGERGQAADEFCSAWESPDLDDIDHMARFDSEFDLPTMADTLEALPQEIDA